MDKIRILIADDINEQANYLKSIIEKHNNVEIIGIANDGQEEYNKIIELQPDIVFTDNKMPKMTGIEVIEKINNNATVEKKPEIVLITSDMSSVYKKINELKINTIMSKPYNEDKIHYVIEDYINSKNAVKQKDIIKEKGVFEKLMSKLNKRKER